MHDRPQEGTEYRHGLTPPMRHVRSRLFKASDLPPPAAMKQLAASMHAISTVSHAAHWKHSGHNAQWLSLETFLLCDIEGACPRCDQ